MRKNERLKSGKEIEILFEKGRSHTYFPFRFIWLLKAAPPEGFPPIQHAILVPKRTFRKASERNHIRRRIREAFRLHQHPWKNALVQKNEDLSLLILYMGPHKPRYEYIEKEFIKAMNSWIRLYEKTS